MIHRFSDFKTFSYSAVTDLCRTLLKDKRVVVALSALALVGAVFCALKLRQPKMKRSLKRVSVVPSSLSTQVHFNPMSKASDTSETRFEADSLVSKMSMLDTPLEGRVSALEASFHAKESGADGPPQEEEVTFILSALFQEIFHAAAPGFTLEEEKTTTSKPNYGIGTKPLWIQYQFKSETRKSLLTDFFLRINWSRVNESVVLDDDIYRKFQDFVNKQDLTEMSPCTLAGSKKPFLKRYSISIHQYVNPFLRFGLFKNSIWLKKESGSREKRVDICAKVLFFACVALGAELATIASVSSLTLFRKAYFDAAYIDRHFVSGEIYVESGFCSTTTNNDASNLSSVCSRANTLLKIDACRSRMIRDYSIFPGENECLFLPGTRFKVLSQTSSIANSKIFWVIELQECV